ncbi:M23 family metallopeptidase [Hankyongella ginsenosidimutans]|uniref:M23 family metallopeptidase n=1 Tax=Hankyongella ginsenosidimutans TaxID=1763828 RepID=UPI001CA31E43|nr:M23 family metallopeptidase [Hankyongella ginsenosidimutans]
MAPAAGIVRLAGSNFMLEGGLVILDHGQGLFSQFLHLSRIDVADGQKLPPATGSARSARPAGQPARTCTGAGGA